MFETWPSRRLIFLGSVVALVILAFFIFGYRLEYVYGGDFVLKKFVSWNKQLNVSKVGTKSTPKQITSSVTSKPPDYLCYRREPISVIESCIPCSDFERNAIKAAYCQETGFYDKLNCTKSNGIGLRPCYDKTIRDSTHFNLFTLFCAVLSVASYSFVNWRQSIVSKRDYMRIRNQLDA